MSSKKSSVLKRSNQHNAYEDSRAKRKAKRSHDQKIKILKLCFCAVPRKFINISVGGL